MTTLAQTSSSVAVKRTRSDLSFLAILRYRPILERPDNDRNTCGPDTEDPLPTR